MTRLALTAATIACVLFGATSTAQCQGWCQGPCFGSYGCGATCICIQPGGPGTQGFCNSR